MKKSTALDCQNKMKFLFPMKLIENITNIGGVDV